MGRFLWRRGSPRKDDKGRCRERPWVPGWQREMLRKEDVPIFAENLIAREEGKPREAASAGCPPASGSREPLALPTVPLLKELSLQPAPVSSVGVCGGSLGPCAQLNAVPFQAHWPLALGSLAKHLQVQRSPPAQLPVQTRSSLQLAFPPPSLIAGFDPPDSSPRPTSACKACPLLELLTCSPTKFSCFFFGKAACFRLPDRQAGQAALTPNGVKRDFSCTCAQSSDAKFGAFLSTTKWFQQLQLREQIRYKTGPGCTSFSSLIRKVKKKKCVCFDPRVAKQVCKNTVLGRGSSARSSPSFCCRQLCMRGRRP